MKNVLISVPNQGWVHKFAATALLRLHSDRRYKITSILPTHKPYVNSLHKIINDVLKGDFDFWVTFDDDNPPRKNILDIIELNLDVVGCPTPVWCNAKPGDYPVYYNGLRKVEGGYLPLHGNLSGLKEVDAVGSGCMIIARRVLEKMKSDPPHDRWFMRQWNENGEVEVGGDYSFCERAKRHGFRIYCHYDYPCYHFNEIEITEVTEAFGRLKGG